MKALPVSSVKLAVIVAIISISATSPNNAVAQEKYKYIFGATVAPKYIEQQVLDVGDVPGHQIRIASLATKYGTEAPVYDGVKVLETKGWLRSDYINRNGGFTQYTVLQMANGDKIYQTIEGQTQTSVGSEGTGKTSFSTITHLTGGTGKFANIRGLIRGSGVSDFKTGPSNNPSEGEYWFEK